ncbi:MAG: arginine repressor [Planctomycetota bacterium]
MTDTVARENRLAFIRELLARRPVQDQSQLIARLKSRGYAVTQSSVSRDLRELRAFKVAGAYQLPAAARNEHEDIAVERVCADLLLAAVPAGEHLLVVRTVIGGAPRLALALDRAGWTEVVGTVAGDDTFFIATASRRAQQRLIARFKPFAKQSGG